MDLDEIARAVRPGDLFRVTHTHFRPIDLVTLNKGATALIVACAEDSLVAEAVVTCPRSGGSRNLQLCALQIAEGGYWERCDAEVR